MSNSSCSKESIEGIRASEFGSTFELGLEESVVLPVNNKELMISLIGINDSRCPGDVQCIWAGNARIQLRISAGTGPAALTELCLGSCDTEFKKTDSTLIRLNERDYSVVLKALEPYPGKGSSEKKKAALSLKKI